MSAPSDSTKPSTTAADCVAKEQHDFPKSGTVEQDTAGDDSLPESLDAKIASEGFPAATSDGCSSTINALPGADLSVPESVASPQDANDGEVWIPKGSPQRPNGTPTGSTGPARPQPPPPPPSRPRRGD